MNVRVCPFDGRRVDTSPKQADRGRGGSAARAQGPKNPQCFVIRSASCSSSPPEPACCVQKPLFFCRLRNLRVLPASLPVTSRVHTCRRGAKLLLPCDLTASTSTLGRRFRLLDLPHLRGRTRPAEVQAQLPIRASPNLQLCPLHCTQPVRAGAASTAISTYNA